MKELKDKVPKDLYWKLSSQCKKRIPMLATVYKNIKRKYG
jgi:hypothetical protein